MKKKRTVYVLYSVSDDISGYGKGDIYAYTTDHDCLDNFISVRDMSKFYLKKVKLTSKEINDLYKEYMDSILSIYSIASPDGNKLKIALTNIERKDYTNRSYIYTNISMYGNAFQNPFIFKNKYITALSKLMYVYAFLYIKNPDFVKDTKNNIRPNALSIIMDVIKETLSEKYKTEWW